MPRLIWTPPALADVSRLHAFLAGKDRAAAIRAVAAIRSGVKLLREHPEAGRPMPGLDPQYREWPVDFGNSGYVVTYRLEGGLVAILAVRHGRERAP